MTWQYLSKEFKLTEWEFFILETDSHVNSGSYGKYMGSNHEKRTYFSSGEDGDYVLIKHIHKVPSDIKPVRHDVFVEVISKDKETCERVMKQVDSAIDSAKGLEAVVK